MEGIQPWFKQVPPKVAYFSMIAVFIPNCAQRIAETYPPGPEPIITFEEEADNSSPTQSNSEVIEISEVKIDMITV